MQALYTLQSNDSYTVPLVERQFDESVDGFFSLYNFVLYNALLVAQYVAKDAEIKASKFLIDEDQKEVNAKLLNNAVVIYLDEEPKFQNWIKKFRAEEKTSESIIQSMYKQLIDEEIYINYLRNPMTDVGDDIEIFEFIIFNTVLPNEVFVENLEDDFVGLSDDGLEVERMLVRNLQKARKRKDPSILLNIKQEKVQELKDFGKELIKKTADHSLDLEEEYSEYLQNWDVNRLATVDTLLLKMALCELLYFKEIPVKVTINEYIDISKEYSTPKSKEFINGILDRIMKDYTQSGKIVKSGRGLKT